MRKFWTLLVAMAAAFPAARLSLAQSVPEVVDAIDHARVTTPILYVDAYPDEERSSVLTYLSRGLSATVALCSMMRGEGGQNAIGPELGLAFARFSRTSLSISGAECILGHGQHQATGIIVSQAVQAADDPTAFPGKVYDAPEFYAAAFFSGRRIGHA